MIERSHVKSVYKRAKWQRLRLAQLARQPLCHYCFQIGLITPATVVDHIKPHRGDFVLAFDAQNLASVCKPCHDRHAQAKDRGIPVAGCDADGLPLDSSHAWGTGPRDNREGMG
jgi:5-methylcytosine-specific restriction endonuclease McrA